MKTPPARALISASMLIAFGATATPNAFADPPTCSIEIGVIEDEEVVWYTNEDNEFEEALDGFIRIDAQVGEWVGVLCDAWVLPPPDPKPPEYLDLIYNFPFLTKEDPTTLDPLVYGAMPDLAVKQALFDDLMASVFETPPLPGSVRSVLQPVMGTSSGAARRDVYGDPVTWIDDGATDMLDLWRNRAIRRELAQNESVPNEIDHFSFQAFWQSVLREEDPTGAAAFFNDRDEFAKAITYGLQLTIQPVVFHSDANDPDDYDPVEEDEADVPGLDGIAGSSVSVGLGSPISFGCRAPGGSGLPTIDQDGIQVLTAGGVGYIWASNMPHKACYLTLVINDEPHVVVGKYSDTHVIKFQVPNEPGFGHVSHMGNPWSVNAFSVGEYSFAISPFGN